MWGQFHQSRRGDYGGCGRSDTDGELNIEGFNGQGLEEYLGSLEGCADFMLTKDATASGSPRCAGCCCQFPVGPEQKANV